MKNIMTILFTGSAFLVFLITGLVFAQPGFSDADSNADGVLSIEEARAALPDVPIEDNNGDGIVNLGEAERAVPGLQLSPDGRGDPDAPVGQAEYQALASAIEEER
ncbi:MAG: hypothetical protein RQ757_12420 [Pseudomonadales bacterium]|nr:hypothetical protein [Pseudomonadales bacterium]